jgi:hypothetical protein
MPKENYHSIGSDGPSAMGGWNNLLPLIHYQDPNHPRFIENRRPVKCSICEEVFRKPEYLTDEGICKSSKECAKRVHEAEVINRQFTRGY